MPSLGLDHANSDDEVSHGELSVLKHKKQHKSLKQHTSSTVHVQDPKAMQSMPKHAEANIRFGGFLHLQVNELPEDLCKWLVDRFDPYSVILYISPDKKIDFTPMDVHLTLGLPIGGRKVEEFYGKKPKKNAKYNEVLAARRKEWNMQDGTSKLSQMPQYILSQADAGKSFKRLCVVHGLLLFQHFKECTLHTLFCQECC
ncbi:hypothetical protein Cgig2_013551 [Carnegiea gigantea]|uniref:Uncharacterized protein n=1 Tax=Carnegiea gigantea TaxID=171969 RepID=A0A9Q1JJS5_9CARY|nr:hypothetical protein Cgig2_013551 [Carnegiea gigantea]